ncbi:MAG TPA: hypothetical protein VF681_07630 [Abditibacteriaceae bacterium]
MNDHSATEPFVDLYPILDLPPDAPVADVRRRIAELYIKAQDNLDHRSFGKRFYYHELYEVHLPHAHHVLLDAARRAEYDAERARQQSATAISSRAASPSATQPAAATSAKTASTQRPPSPPPPVTHQTPQYHETLARDLNIEHKPRPPAPEWARMDRAIVERRRDSSRRTLIKFELQAAGQRAALLVGGGVFLVLSLAVWLGGEAMGVPVVVRGLGIVASLAAAGASAYAASRSARRTIISTLSQMPYGELLHRYKH